MKFLAPYLAACSPALVLASQEIQTMTADQIISLIQGRQWTILLALLVGLATRYTKPDVIFPSLPARWRPLFAAAASIVGAGSAAVVAGVPLATAGNAAFEAFVLATMGHVLGIGVVRGGVELPMPGIRKPPSGPPSSRTHISGIGGIVLLAGCSSATADRQLCYAEVDARFAAAVTACPGAWDDCPEREAILARAKAEDEACP